MSVGIVTRVIKKLSQLLDVDVSSAATGSSLIYNGSGWTTLKHNFAGTTAPGVGDDSADGYAVGSLWFDLTSSPNEIYRCLDATEGAAVWVNTSLEVGELGALAILDTVNNAQWSGTDLAVTNGGTGASDASGARSNLGLGTIATQAANNVSLTGGSITGITDLAVADGGTGASTALGAVQAIQGGNAPETKTDSYVVLTTDLWKTLRMNSSSDKIFTLPSVGESNDGAEIAFENINTGRLTLQSVDSDKIGDSTAAGTCYSDTDSIASIRLKYCHATVTWNIISGCGTWVTT